MSNLDSATMEKVAKKLAAQLADAHYQLAQMTVIAELFKEQRDNALNELTVFRTTYVPHTDNTTNDTENTTE